MNFFYEQQAIKQKCEKNDFPKIIGTKNPRGTITANPREKQLTNYEIKCTN